MLDGDRKALSLQQSFRNVLTLGAVGTGKSAIGVIPTLLRGGDTSKVVIDTSGELFAQTAGALRQGYRIEVLDLMDLDRTGLQYNPFSRAETILDLHKICRQIVQAKGPGAPGDQFWLDGAVNLLAIIAYCLRSHKPSSLTLANLAALCSRFDCFSADPGTSFFDSFVLKHTIDAPTVRNAYLSLINGNPQTVLSWVATANNALTPLLSPEIADLTTTTSFDFQTLRDEPTVLYVKVNQRDISFYGFVLNLFFEDLLGSLTSELDSQGRPVLLLLDEFGQFHIDRFEVFVATARKYRVGMWVFLQNLAQLEDQYGREKARTIYGNLSTKAYFGGIELQTAQQLEQSIGQVKIKARHGQDYIHHRESLLSAQEIMQIPDQDLLIIPGNKAPFLIHGTPHYRHSRWKRMISLTPPILPSFQTSQSQVSIQSMLELQKRSQRTRSAPVLEATATAQN